MTEFRNLERRASLGQFEIRANGGELAGYAARFDVVADMGSFTEVIRPGAFANSLAKNPDILALADHDPARVLGRTRSGSLRIAEDRSGLGFTLQLPDTSAGRDLAALARRGDLGGASFGFRAVTEKWNGTGTQRELLAVDLLEISVVAAWPAYPETSVVARAHQMPVSRPAGGPGARLRRRAAYLGLGA